MSSLPNDPVPLYDFNPGTKTWKIHAHKISSITDGNLVLQAAGENSEIYFAQKNNEVYKISDLLASGSIDYVTVNSHPGSISIGQYAMNSNAGTTGNIAIGHYASYNNSHNSGTYRIAIGTNAGYTQQQGNSIAIGYSSGANNQGANCISIGYKAGETDQASNSIILNANTNALNAGNTGFFVNPIRSDGNNINVILCHDTSTNEIKRSGIYISGTDLTNANVVSAQNFNIGGSNVISASRQGNFTDLELKNNYGTKLLIDGDTGDITAWGTLSIDNIIEKTSGSGVTIGGGINITGTNLTNANAISAQNFNIGGTNVISAARQGNFRDIEMKNNSNQTTFLAYGDTGNIDIYGNLSVDNITEKTSGSGITLSSVVNMTGIQSASNSNKLLYNATSGEITYQPDSGGGGGSVNHLTIEDSPGGIFIGENVASTITAKDHVISIGHYAGHTNSYTATTDRIAIGNSAGYLDQQQYSIAIGTGSGVLGHGYASIAIGKDAANGWSGARHVCIGLEAGKNGGAAQAVQIGYRAGYSSSNGWYSVAIGKEAANAGQGESCVHIGDQAGGTGNGKGYNVGIGFRAGHTWQDEYSVSIGPYAGYQYQSLRSVAIGLNAGRANQGAYCVAIGNEAGKTDQAANSIVLNAQSAIALDASNTGFFVKPIRNVASTTGDKLCYDSGTGEISYQPDSGGGGVNHLTIEDSPGGIFIGENTAANILSNDNVISIGNYAGNNVSTVTTDRIAIGNYAGYTEQQTYSICIGTSAGQNGGASRSVIIGYRAGMWWPGSRSVFIGEEAGYNGSSGEAVHIGYRAGYQSAGYRSVGIGNLAASTGQGNHSIYIGDEAGATGLEKTGVIGIGNRAGHTHQLDYSIAIGTNAGWLYQNTRCVAIGLSAGRSNQGAYSVAIGCQAGNTDQAPNSIILNAQTDTSLDTTNSGFYVKPIRNVASGTGDKLCYDSTTGEITYQPDSGGGGGGGSTAIDIPIPAVNYDFRDAQVSGNKITWSNSYGSGHHAILGGSGANLVDSSPDHVQGTSTSWISLHGAISIINNPEWSFEMYIKKNSGTTSGGYLTFGPFNASSSDFDPTFSLEIEHGSTNLTAWWGTTSSNFEPNRLHISELADQWTHWVVTYNGTTIKLYRNYSTSTTHDTTSGVSIPYYGFDEIKIGRTAWTHNDVVSEETRFVRFYSKSLTDDEVNKLYLNRDTEGPINSIYEPATTNPDTELTLKYPYKISELQGTTYNSKFGLASSMNSDGTRMAVGVPGSNLVKVYDWDGSTWNQIGADLTFSSLVATEFGSDLEMNNTGNVVIVGDGSAYGNRGAVAIYEWNGSSWSQRGGDIISPFNGNGYFGRSVSISDDGSIIAVGCHNENMHGYYYSGRVYIYQWNGSAWNAYGDSPTQAGGNGSHVSVWGYGKFGGVVKLAGDGNSFITGQESANNGNGKIWLFELQNGTWTTINITYPSYQTGWQEGFGKAVSGTSDLSIIAVAVGGQNLHFHRSGSVYMLKRSGNDYVPYGSSYIIEGEGGQNDFFGGSTGPSYKNNLSLSSDGKTVAISSVYNEANYTASNSNVGQVKVYKYNEGYNGGTWSLLFKTLFGEDVSDYFGYLDLTPDGLRLSVGAPQINSSNGYLYVYDLTDYTTTKLSTNASLIGVGNDVDLTTHESSHYTNDEIENKSSDELKYGTQGQYLVSGGPSNPMKWISKPYASFVRPWNAPQFTIVANSAWTEINWTQVKFSSGIYLDSGGYHFRVIRSGAYNISVQCRFGGGDMWTGLVLLDKDEVYVGRGIIAQSAAFGTTHLQSDLVHLNILAEINETQHCVLAFYRQDGDMTIANTIPNSNVGHQMVCNITCVS